MKSQEVQNAIRWIDALDPMNGFKKTTSALGHRINAGNDQKSDWSYCCFGVGCRIMNYETVDFERSYDHRLESDMGLNTMHGLFMDPITRLGHFSEFSNSYNEPIRYLTDINDVVYKYDMDFKNVRNFILENLKYIFVPSVAKELEIHYSK